jgi:hypothetical protein
VKKILERKKRRAREKRKSIGHIIPSLGVEDKSERDIGHIIPALGVEDKGKEISVV